MQEVERRCRVQCSGWNQVRICLGVLAVLRALISNILFLCDEQNLKMEDQSRPTQQLAKDGAHEVVRG